MIRLLAASLVLTLAASPSFACPWSQTSAVDTPSTTAAAQPTTPAAPCANCVVPSTGTPRPAAQAPS